MGSINTVIKNGVAWPRTYGAGVRVDTGEGKKATSNTASGLDLHAFYCKGALVLLTKNVCQSLGLCNGSTGKIVDIIYTHGKPPPALPECIIVNFGDNYSGPSFFPDDDSKKGWVPIF